MRWRVLAVAVVLLAVGAVGGYAVADRSRDAPRSTTVLDPVPASDPSVPAGPPPSYEPDPDTPPLQPSDLTTEPVSLRVDAKGLGVRVSVPVGWLSNRVANTNQWNFVPADNVTNTYLLRVTIVRGANASIAAAMAGRIAALQDAEANGGLKDLTITEQTSDTLEATYVSDGHLRLTTERWVTYDGTNAYASVGLTGREVDEDGLGELLARTVTSMQELPARPAP